MNYEAKMVDLSGAPSVTVTEVETEQPDRKRMLWIAGGIIGALLAVAAWMLSHGEEETAFAPRDGAIPSVTVVSPGRGTVAGIVNATGTFAAVRRTPVGVVGEGGRVVAVNVDRGQWVRAGQVLVVIDRSVQTQQAQSSSAQIEVAKADAKLAQSNLDRATQLLDRGFISRAEIDRLTAVRDSANARVRVSEAQYRELLARNARLNVVAPASGLILDRTVEVGQVIGSGTALFTMARDGQMEFLAQVGETDLANIPLGATGEVNPVGTDQRIPARLRVKDPVINEQTRQGVARFTVPYSQNVRPGGFGSVAINSGAIVAPKLPESAILTDDKGSFVYIVEKKGNDSVVVRRDVTVGLVTDDGITIAGGLNGTEPVVVRAGGFLSPGDKVKPVTSQ